MQHMLYSPKTTIKNAMKILFLTLAFVSLNALAEGNPNTAVIGDKVFACTSKEKFDAAMDYLSQQEFLLFQKLFTAKRPICQVIPEGETVAVRSRSMWSTVIRRKGSETLLYTNPGAFK